MKAEYFGRYFLAIVSGYLSGHALYHFIRQISTGRQYFQPHTFYIFHWITIFSAVIIGVGLTFFFSISRQEKIRVITKFLIIIPLFLLRELIVGNFFSQGPGWVIYLSAVFGVILFILRDGKNSDLSARIALVVGSAITFFVTYLISFSWIT